MYFLSIGPTGDTGMYHATKRKAHMPTSPPYWLTRTGGVDETCSVRISTCSAHEWGERRVKVEKSRQRVHY